MRFKRIFLLVCFVICLFMMASVCASDLNDTAIASEDNLEIDQTTDDVIGVGDNEEMDFPQTNEILTAGEKTFAQLNKTINANKKKDIYLDSDYKYSEGDDSFKGGIVISRDVNIYGNGHTINGSGQTRIFQIGGGKVVFHNINFVNGNAGDYAEGGAINGDCKAIACTFKNNHAGSGGGAMHYGTAVKCNFTGNNVFSDVGGAMLYGSAVNCNFTGNNAMDGGAIYSTSVVNCTFTENTAVRDGGAMGYGSAVNCTFTGNKAIGGGAIFSGSAVNCTFTGNNATKGNAIYYGYMASCRAQSPDDYSYTNNLILQWDVNDFTTRYGSSKTFNIQLRNQAKELINFINYDVVIYKDGVKVKTYHCLSNDALSLDLAAGIYTAELEVTYPNLEPISKNITIIINKATPNIKVSARDAKYPKVVISVKSNVGGKYIVKIGNKSQKVILKAGVVQRVTFTGLPVNEKGYVVKAYNNDIENYTGCNDSEIVKVKKGTVKLTAGAITTTYNIKKNLVITLKNSQGKALKGIKIKVALKGAKKYTTDKKGRVKIAVGSLAPKKYTAKITFSGNKNYAKSSKSVKVTVKKATPKLTAKAKTFKKSLKTKKYTITLKTNKNKALSKVKVTLKVKGKTLTAKTNSKGKAIFKIKNLNKKAKVTATVKFAGNKYYKAVTKKVKITVK